MCYPDDADTAKLSVKYQENTVRLELFTVQNGHISYSGTYHVNLSHFKYDLLLLLTRNPIRSSRMITSLKSDDWHLFQPEETWDKFN